MSIERTAESQKGRILEYKHFDLLKLKMNKKDAYIQHQVSGTEGGTFVMTDGQTPHPDLQKSLDGLKKIMARRLGLLEGTDVAREIAKGDLSKYETAMNKEKEIIERCNVNGLTFTGSGDKFGVMITGSILLPFGGSCGLAVSRIVFGEDVLGYEDEVEELCEEVKKEAYAYRFQNKKAQLDLEFEAEKAEKEQKEAFANETQFNPDENSETKESEPLEATVIPEKVKKVRGKKADLI